MARLKDTCAISGNHIKTYCVATWVDHTKNAKFMSITWQHQCHSTGFKISRVGGHRAFE